jgi:hypothetical protein
LYRSSALCYTWSPLTGIESVIHNRLHRSPCPFPRRSVGLTVGLDFSREVALAKSDQGLRARFVRCFGRIEREGVGLVIKVNLRSDLVEVKGSEW